MDGRSCSAEDCGGTAVPANQPPVHLVVLVNGVFGSASNWAVIRRCLAEQLGDAGTLIHVSCSNQYRQTFDGIDSCGRRLAAEIREAAGRYPSLQRVSLVCHSMGGLIGRYAAGIMFDPASCTLSGLRPSHYVAIATPHLGCETDPGPAQVPLVGWGGGVPLLGAGLQRALAGVARGFAYNVYGRSGRQLFLADGGERAGGEPLLLRMTQDAPEEGYFFSALGAFETRTLYANRGGDYNVGWANASLRPHTELPSLPDRCRGVAREDPLEAAWDPEVWALGCSRGARCSGGSPAGQGHPVTVRSVLQAGSPGELAAGGEYRPHGEGGGPAAAMAAAAMEGAGGGLGPRLGQGAQAAQQAGVPAGGGPGAGRGTGPSRSSGAAVVAEMLARLARLPWRRIDVCFGRSLLPFLSHAHIQVTREWVNWEGMATAKHVALQLAALEAARPREDSSEQ